MADAIKNDSRVLITDEALYFFLSGIFLSMIDKHGEKCLSPKYKNLFRMEPHQMLSYLYHEFSGKPEDLFNCTIDVTLDAISKMATMTDAKNIIDMIQVTGLDVTVIGSRDINYIPRTMEARIGIKNKLTATIIKEIEESTKKFDVIVASFEQVLELAPDLLDMRILYPRYKEFYIVDENEPFMFYLKKEYQQMLSDWKITHNHEIVGIDAFGSRDSYLMGMG